MARAVPHAFRLLRVLTGHLPCLDGLAIALLLTAP
jgi:hypothetical protein